MLNVAIAGASGYSGAELKRILVRHPDVRLRTVLAGKNAGERVDALYPDLARRIDLSFGPLDPNAVRGADVLFLALPSGEAMRFLPGVCSDVGRVIDLSGDFRLSDADVYRRYYHKLAAIPGHVFQRAIGLERQGTVAGAADQNRRERNAIDIHIVTSGDLAGARATFEAALAADPDRLAALNDLAVSYHLEGRDEAARQLLDEVVARGGSQEQLAALVNLAGLYALQGYLPVAQAHVDAARGVDLSRPEPLYAAALLADARADAAAAVALARQALRADEGGRCRQELAFASPEERLHLEALLAEATGDRREEGTAEQRADGHTGAVQAGDGGATGSPSPAADANCPASRAGDAETGSPSPAADANRAPSRI